MQSNNNQSFDSKHPVFLRSLLKLKTSVGISVNFLDTCPHSFALSSRTICSCNFCNFLYRLFNFSIKSKCISSRPGLLSISGRSFPDLFNSSCFLFEINRDRRLEAYRNAASSSDNRLSCQHDCPLPGMSGIDTETSCSFDYRSFCDNAQHLFECFSTCEQARRRFFSIPREGFCWHATCATCGASCSFTSPREGVILSTFMSLLTVSYNGRKYYTSLFCSDNKVHVSREMAELILMVQGGHITWDNMEIANKDPLIINVKSDVCLLDDKEIGIDFGVTNLKRFAKDCDVLSDEACRHNFFLTSSDLMQLRLSPEMMRVLLMLMPSHAYMQGIDHFCETFLARDDFCGIASVGGLIGVNLRCNGVFMDLHSRFYEGSYRQGAHANVLPFVTPVTNCESQSSSDELSDGCSEEHPQAYTSSDLSLLVRDFVANDDSLLEIPLQSNMQGRGLGDLAKRVGGLLKGVTKCVTKLHAVWDWPLDTLLSSVNGVGEWLEQNDKHVSKDVWACTMCPQIQKDVESVLSDQNKMLELLRATLKKLAGSVDAVSTMNKTNMECIESEISELKDKMAKLKDNPKGAAPSLEAIAKVVAQNVKKVQGNVDEINARLDNLSAEIDRIGKDKKRPKRPVKVEAEDNELTAAVGEQMGIPRNKPQSIVKYGKRNPGAMPFEFAANSSKSSVVDADTLSEYISPDGNEKQFSTGDSLGIVGCEEVQLDHVTPTISHSGTDEVHDALRSDIYLGLTKWSVSSGEGSVLKSFELPGAIWANNPRMKSFASFFQYYTCTGLRFKVTTTSVGMQGGTLMVCWDALSCATKQKINSVIQLSNLASAYIHASQSEVLEFEVSSPSIQHMMCLSGSEHSESVLGTFYICVANVLNAAAETSQTVQINVWVSFVNPVFSFYTLQHELVDAHNSSRIDSLRGIESFKAIVATGKWATTSAANLMELTVHPTACHISNGLVTQTSLSVVSHLFNRWNGSLKYSFVFGASMFVRGKVIVSAIPIAFRDKKMSVEQIASFPSIVCDLSTDNREFSFEVPYHSIGINSLVARDSLYDISSYNSELVVSRLHMVVLDPLVMNANASNSISFFVTVQPGATFSLFDFSGVKAEFVDRLLKQSFHDTLSCGKILGSGFDSWTQRDSVLHKFVLDNDKKNALCVMVSPCYRQDPPCTTSLSWLAQIFVEWSGSLVYTFRAHSHKRNNASLLRFWYDSNGSTKSGAEFVFVTDVDPPSGAKVLHWCPNDSPVFEFVVPFCARTRKLKLHKARYIPSDSDWLNFYNGMFVIDLQGQVDIEIEMSIRAGFDFEMYEQTVAPRCGKVSEAFTRLSYNKELRSITSFPRNDARLSGPVNKAVTTSVVFKPVDAVNESPDSLSGAPKANQSRAKLNKKRDPVDDPQEGDVAKDEDGESIIFQDGEWHYLDAEAQMNCVGCFKVLDNASQLTDELRTRKTVSKLADCVDATHSFIGEDGTKNEAFESLKFLLPLLKKADKLTHNFEAHFSELSSMRDRITSTVRGLLSETIPGLIQSCVENERYFWATIVTLFGGISLLWFCKSKKKFLKKLGVLCMVVWSPFLIHKAWDLGKWIVSHFSSFFQSKPIEETCRSHSSVGAFEGVAETFGHLADWFSGNWVTAIQSLLTLLGVVTSLVLWGTIPDGKKLTTFASKFKEVGDKGRTFSNIFSGFSSIIKMCSEWSGKLVSWVLGQGENMLPKSDSALQILVNFDIATWVKETRELALQENKFVGFGTPEYITKVRHLYDKSCKIQSALLTGCKVDVQLSMIVKECKDKCTELLNNTYSFKGMKQPRIDPIHICLIGAPGVGKSAISHLVIDNLLDYRGEPEVDRIFTRCCADQYWSNYQQEPVVLYDDLGAISSKLKMSDYAEIMGMKTNDPFSVPMAIAEDKGKHCTSRYIVSCTNVLELDDSGDVVTKPAYYRRRNVLVQVEKDDTIPKDESDPTKGLSFTVLGYELSGNNDERVIFGLKTTWDEPFLRDIDTRQWVFDKVDFRCFMKFLCQFTDAYMSSQEKLLKGIKTFRVNPFEEFIVEKQAGETSLETGETLQGIIAIFDNQGFSGRDIYNRLVAAGITAPYEWCSQNKISFSHLLTTCCGCHEERACNIDFFLQRVFQECCGVGPFCHEAFVVKRVHHNPLDTLVKVKNRELLGTLDPLALFVTIATYYRWSSPNTMCPYFLERRVKRDTVHSFPGIDVTYADRINPHPETFELKGESFILWPSSTKMFPETINKDGYVHVKVGHNSFLLSPQIASQLPVGRKEDNWKRIFYTGFEIECEGWNLFHPDDHIVIKGLMDNISELGTPDNPSVSFLESCNLILEFFGEGPQSALIVLHIIHSFWKKDRMRQAECERIAKRNAFTSHKKLLDYEKKVAGNLSGKAKIALAVGGGVLAIGTIIGTFFGIKSLFDMVSHTSERMETEDASAEGSCANASSAFQTTRVIAGRKAPRVVVTTLEPHGSSPGASSQFQTKHSISRRRKPMSLVPESFGVTYDERDLEPDLKKNRRKAQRKHFTTAVQEARSGTSSISSPNLKNIVRWQDEVKSTGIKGAFNKDTSKAIVSIARSIVSHAESGLCGELTTIDDCFVHEEEIQSVLSDTLKPNQQDISRMLDNGLSVRVVKQANVGSFGVIKDLNMLQLLRTHVSKMSCTIISKVGDNYAKNNVLRLCSTFVLMPAHYVEIISKASDIFFVCPDKVVRIAFEPDRMTLVSEYQDLIVWDLGNNVPPSTNFLPHIAKDDDWENYRKCSGALSMTEYSTETTMIISSLLESIEMVNSDVEVPTGTYEMFGTTHTVVKGLRYRVHCMPGFCGAAVLRADSRNVRKIIGIHVAGAKSKSVGYAEILSVELLEEAIKRLGGLNISKEYLSREKVDYCEKQSVTIQGKGNLGLLGVVAPKCVPRLPAKTTIAKSDIHSLIGPVRSEPAILSAWDTRLGDKRGSWFPVLEGVKKYGTPTKPFPLSEIVMVEKHLSQFFRSFSNSLRKREVNDIEIGVNGIDGTNFWAAMPMDTSAGYPYVLRRPSGAVGKGWLFEQLEDYPSGRKRFLPKDPDFVESLQVAHDQIKRGIIPHILTMECPKDERRKLSKIYDRPATRTFTVLPPEINLLFRMYFGDFSAMIMETRADHFSQVGINPETLEWSELMSKFLSVGKQGFAGDYAKFDGVGAPNIYHSIVNVINSWYDDGEENARARHCLINSIIHRNGIAGEFLFSYSQGMPSGFSMTVIFNSFVNYYYLALAWHHIVGSSKLSPQKDLASFDYYTKVVVYGDDNIVAVDDDFLHIFNLQTVASYLSGYGVTYTDDAKNPIHLSKPFVDIHTVTFLKRSFVKVEKSGMLWKAPLDKTSIEERCNWIRECEIPAEALYQNIESALFEASVHGEEYFSDLKQRVDQALESVVLNPTTDTFESCQSRWWGTITNFCYTQPDISKIIKLAGKNNVNLGSKFKDCYSGRSVELLEAIKKAKYAPAAWFNP
uniref:Genome polyprotein n=1 Tax=Ajuga reptans waikavirus TaxID=3027334 RepID=A0AA48PAS1_9SECO|nr:TPA_asm: polyprotein [Ajuga reptans waikavirus]